MSEPSNKFPFGIAAACWYIASGKALGLVLVEADRWGGMVCGMYFNGSGMGNCSMKLIYANVHLVIAVYKLCSIGAIGFYEFSP